MKKIGITLGDPTGIGPEIVKKALIQSPPNTITIIYGTFPQNFSLPHWEKIKTAEEAENSNSIYWLPLHKDKNFIAGKPSADSGLAAYETIKKAGLDADNKRISAIITAPLSKKYIQMSKANFIGHTEFFAEQSNTDNFVMCFYSNKLVVALLTTHLALKDLHKNLKYDTILKKILLINSSIKRIKKIEQPKIALLGVNPHSGEDGSFGTIEIELFKPMIKSLRSDAINISGPYPADTFFAGNYKDFDVIISAYHDQGLIPFKLLTFGEGLNITLGLPYVRTSVDHGTAFDIAGQNVANAGSMIEAVKLAEKLI